MKKNKQVQKSITFSIRINSDLKKQLELSAQKNGVKANRLINTVLTSYLTKESIS